MSRRRSVLITLFGSILALFLSIISCSKKIEAQLAPLSAAEITAASLWKRITLESPYSSYSFWPGHEGVREGQAPHGPYHKVFVNAALLKALPSPTKTAPDGSIIVKENMNGDQKVNGLTVMAKVSGYDSEHKDWFWAKYDMDGKVAASGKVKGCISCHEGMKDNDYIIVRALDKQ